MTVRFSRRRLLGSLLAATAGASASGWFPAFADSLIEDPKRRRHCILLWMSGGPSQTDTFDLKPDHENGGEFDAIETSAPGLRISQHLPELAKMGDKLAVIRSLSTREGDHGRGTFLMRTGHPPMGPVQYPSIAIPPPVATTAKPATARPSAWPRTLRNLKKLNTVMSASTATAVT